MIQFELQPVGDVDSVKIEADSRDIYMWEKTNRGKSFGALKNNLMMEDLYSLAYTAMRRQQAWRGSIDDFVEEFALKFKQRVEVADEDPTQPAASDAP